MSASTLATLRAETNFRLAHEGASSPDSKAALTAEREAASQLIVVLERRLNRIQGLLDQHKVPGPEEVLEDRVMIALENLADHQADAKRLEADAGRWRFLRAMVAEIEDGGEA